MDSIPGWENGVLGGKGLTCWFHVNMVALLGSESFGTVNPGIISITCSFLASFYTIPIYML